MMKTAFLYSFDSDRECSSGSFVKLLFTKKDLKLFALKSRKHFKLDLSW